MIDPAELTDELWREFVKQQLAEMLAIHWYDGPFKAGWASAIEELEERLLETRRRTGI